MAQKNQKSITGKVLKDLYKICPNCSNFLPLIHNDDHCSVCGEKYVSECPQCKEPIIYPISKFCPVCGTKLENK